MSWLKTQLQLTDCSEVIPQAISFKGGAATLPPGKTMGDIEQAVSSLIIMY